MPIAAPTAAPPSMYDNLPTGGGAQPQPGAKNPESDTDEEILKGLTGVYRVLSKMAKIKGDLKPAIKKIQEDVKTLVVQGLKKDPSSLTDGDDGGAAAEPPPAAKPTSTDETHAA